MDPAANHSESHIRRRPPMVTLARGAFRRISSRSPGRWSGAPRAS